MEENKPGPGPHPENPTVGHEQRDVNAFAVTAAGMAIFGLVVVVVFAMWFVFNLFSRNADRGAERPELAREETLPPEPRLQNDPVGAYHDIRRAEDQLLEGYAWIDPEKGVVRIPVNRALDLLAQRGFPAAQAPTQAPVGAANPRP